MTMYTRRLFCNACNVNLILNKPNVAVYFGHFFKFDQSLVSFFFRSPRLCTSDRLVSESESLEKTRLTNHRHELYQNLDKPRFEV